VTNSLLLYSGQLPAAEAGRDFEESPATFRANASVQPQSNVPGPRGNAQGRNNRGSTGSRNRSAPPAPPAVGAGPSSSPRFPISHAAMTLRADRCRRRRSLPRLPDPRPVVVIDHRTGGSTHGTQVRHRDGENRDAAFALALREPAREIAIPLVRTHRRHLHSPGRTACNRAHPNTPPVRCRSMPTRCRKARGDAQCATIYKRCRTTPPTPMP